MGFVRDDKAGRKLQRVLAAVLAILICATGPFPSVAIAKKSEPTKIALSEMAGKWKGLGWGKRHSSAPKEGVRCRLTAKYRAKRRMLSVSGKCAATSRTFTLLGHVAEYSGSNRITGRWINPSGIGAINLAGNRRGNELIFSFEAKDEKTEKKRKFRTIWLLKKSGFDLRTQTAQEKFLDIGNIQFQR